MASPRDPIVNGKDFNFFQKVTTSSMAFPFECDVLFNFKAQQSFSLINEGNAVVEYSFNGNTLHGDMTPATSTEALFFDNRFVSKIWFRVPTGASVTIRVEAWSHA